MPSCAVGARQWQLACCIVNTAPWHRELRRYRTATEIWRSKLMNITPETGCQTVRQNRLKVTSNRFSPSNTRYIRPTQVITPNGISIGLAVFVWVPNAMLYNALSVKITGVVREICSWTDTHTDTHTYALITILCHRSRGRSNDLTKSEHPHLSMCITSWNNITHIR